MFQVHSKVIQLYKYTYVIFEIIFLHRLLEDIDYDCFHLGHHIAGSRGKLTGFTSLDQSVEFYFINPPSSLRKMDHLTSKTPGFFSIFLTSLLISMLSRFLIISIADNTSICVSNRPFKLNMTKMELKLLLLSRFSCIRLCVTP